MRLRFTTLSMCVTIVEDSLTLHTIDPDAIDGVGVPMSYCAVNAYTRNDDTASVVIALELNARRLHPDGFVSSQGPRYVVIPVRDICEDGSQEYHLLCHCTNADLCMSALEIISAIENLNGEYLSMHGDDPSVIRDVSMTMCLGAKARKIICKRHYGTKFHVPMPID